jgi:hypothetical protein
MHERLGAARGLERGGAQQELVGACDIAAMRFGISKSPASVPATRAPLQKLLHGGRYSEQLKNTGSGGVSKKL